MAWIEPKTDWVETDFFSAADYNRIKNNLSHLKFLSQSLFKDFGIAEMGADKTYKSYIFADEINAIEDNLETINANTYAFSIGNKQTFKDNGNTPLWSEYNRIESATLKIFRQLYGQRATMNRLAFKLGTKTFGKRVRIQKNETIDYRLDFRLGVGKGLKV